MKVTNIVKELDDIRVARPSRKFKKADNDAYYVLKSFNSLKFKNIPILLKFFKTLKAQKILEVSTIYHNECMTVNFNDNRSSYSFRSY